MAELVTCPRCEGIGTVRLRYPEMQPTARDSGITDNIAKFLGTMGIAKEEKRKKEFITCPNCNGFGLVRG
ncbi:hypothetical protein ACFLWD_03650 [Chloroflexota bacterium]